ncbi:MAG: terpene cyclase/mutase family protein [Planctomycetaceae bacterium]|nr:terpene cyclase/mutase family protein [Planctomycetaceae bacterium]
MWRYLLVSVSMTAMALTGGCKNKDDKAATPRPAAGVLSMPKPATDAMDAPHVEQAGKLINGGVSFLLAARTADGGWGIGGPSADPAITALVLKALLGHADFTSSSPEVQKALAVVLKYQQPDGGIYDPKQGFQSYTTATAVTALAATKDPQYNSAMAAGVKFLRSIQIKSGDVAPDGTKIEDSDVRRGGVGYGTSGEPNLSVLNFWMEAMKDAGVPPEDPAMKEALLFLTNLQNRSESSSRPVAPAVNDGGFPYDPKESKAGAGPDDKGLRSYGSMTYAGFKSMLYAGVTKDDPRVRAAFDWIRTYWRLDSNPNMPQAQSQQGLYYYYMVFAKALRAWHEPVITDPEGAKHNWRQELVDALAKRVRPNGTWKNEADRWMEGNDILPTTYCVLALQETLQK